jgi:Ser/Thr protein kinase RdoA (MazF antagonist)
MDLAMSVLELTRAAAVREVAEGHQSRVFELTPVDGQRFVAKVLDAALVDAHAVAARVDAVAELAELDPRVCRPIRIGGSLVNVIADDVGRPALLVCSEFAEGVAFDVANPADAELMGETLAGLHRSLARIARRGIPEVAALRAVPSDLNEEFQLLHGDFNSENLRRAGSTVRVFDFEDCGYGPRSFEIANALYMVLFTATIEAEAERYRTFEGAFLGGYEGEAAHEVDRRAVEQLIDLRVHALECWLDDLPTAPIGIRTATPQWRQTLRSFVGSYERRQP